MGTKLLIMTEWQKNLDAKWPWYHQLGKEMNANFQGMICSILVFKLSKYIIKPTSIWKEIMKASFLLIKHSWPTLSLILWAWGELVYRLLWSVDKIRWTCYNDSYLEKWFEILLLEPLFMILFSSW